jgi:tetratricopeptide (TPR) repeat protein
MLTIAQIFDMAVQHHQAGRMQQAEQLYRQLLQLEPLHVGALHLLGLLAHQVDRSDLAIEYIRQALLLQPNLAEAHCHLGMALVVQGNLSGGVASYQQALRLKPDFAEAHYNLANALRRLGRLPEAVASYQQALRSEPDFAAAYNNLGRVLVDQGKFAEAAASCEQALRLQPNLAEAHNNLANALRQQGNLAEAVAGYQEALRLKPDYADAHNNLGLALAAQEKLTEAVASYQQALRLQPGLVEAHNNLASAFLQQGSFSEAVASCQQALRLQPDLAEAAHNNLANALRQQGNLAEAIVGYQEALRLKPDYAEAHFNLGWAWLLGSNFEQGWPEYEWRWKLQNITRPLFPQPLWDGSSLLDQTILLFAEQGLGDTLQFIRYARLVKERGATVLVHCHPPLLRLLATCAGIDRLVPAGAELPPFDVQAPLLSLPGIFHCTLATIPATVPYLFAAAERRAQWLQQLSGVKGFKVGIVWQGDPKHKGDRRRSLPLRAFEALAHLPGVQLLSLQKGPGREQLAELADRLGIIDLGDRLEDFADTAAVLMNLDLVITVDTAVAHLAGALAMPVWVLLPVDPDWRWLLGREDSPWYPSMRLFRQSAWGDWSSVFERLTEALRQRVEAVQRKAPDFPAPPRLQ